MFIFLSTVWDYIKEHPLISYTLNTAIVIAIIVLSNRIITLLFRKLNRKNLISEVSYKFLKNLVKVIVLTVILFVYLSNLPVTKDISGVLLQGGSLIIALLTFSCQKVLSNLLAGIIISINKPFNIGDKITVLGGTDISGYVTDINLRHTTLTKPDGKSVLIPNGFLDESPIMNEDAQEKNGYPLEIECTYGSDPEKAIEIFRQEIIKNNNTLNTEENTSVTCAELSPNGFKIKGIVWTETVAGNFAACSELRIAIFRKWKEAGIELPYQTVTIIKEDN